MKVEVLRSHRIFIWISNITSSIPDLVIYILSTTPTDPEILSTLGALIFK